MKASELRYQLEKSQYPTHLANFLIDGFTNGFKIHHTGDLNNSSSVPSKVPLGLEQTLVNKINYEIEQGRILGPFVQPPFNNFHISPVSLREKSTPGKYRMIQNLSHPHDGSSINANIEEVYKSVKYSSIRDAIELLAWLPKGAYMGKTDIKDAFRIMPINNLDQCKLGFKFQDCYYFDKTLPMGCAMSCKLFESFASALEHIFQFNDQQCYVIHYLDDFLFINNSKKSCEDSMNLFASLCEKLGVPLSPDKTTSPDMKTIFLGIELDSLNQCAKLPLDKLESYYIDIKDVSRKRTVTKKHLQSVIGKLSFAASVIPGRAFLRRLIDLLSAVKSANHFVTLPSEVKLDLDTWAHFLKNYNGITFFRSLTAIPSNCFNMHSDASKLAFGATFKNHWLQCMYPQDWQLLDITVLELYPIFVLVSMFGEKLKNSTVIFHCDNMAVCYIINKLTSKHKFVMTIVRQLVWVLVKYNIDLKAKHVPGVDNIMCDRISRLQDVSHLLGDMDAQSTPIPNKLLPQNFPS